MGPLLDPTPRPTEASILGGALGQGIARNFPQPEMMVQRGLLQDALGKVGALAKDPQSSPIDILLATMQAGAGIPGFEKYAGAILPKLLEMSAYRQQITGEGKPPEMALQPGGQQQQPQQQLSPEEQLISPGTSDPIMRQMGIIPQREEEGQPSMQPGDLPGIQLGEYIPVDVGSYIDPQKTKEIVEAVGRAGGDANLVKQRINDFNQGQIDYNALLNANVDKKTAQIERQLGLESQVQSFLDKQLSPQVPQERKNLYYELLKKQLPNSPDLTSAYQKVAQEIHTIEKQFEEFPGKIPPSDPVGMRQGQKKVLRQTSKDMMDIDPLAYPILESMFTQAGHPITDAAETLKPLPENVSKIVTTGNDYRPLIYPKTPMSETGMINNLEAVQKDQDQEMIQMKRNLGRVWNADLSLINTYTELKKRGWFPAKIIDLFSEMEKIGVQFSPQQKAERVQLASPPVITPQKLFE